MIDCEVSGVGYRWSNPEYQLKNSQSSRKPISMRKRTVIDRRCWHVPNGRRRSGADDLFGAICKRSVPVKDQLEACHYSQTTRRARGSVYGYGLFTLPLHW